MKSKSARIFIVLMALGVCIFSGCAKNTSVSADKEAFDEYVAFNSLERLAKDGVNYKKEFYAIEDNKQVLVASQYWDSGKLYVEYDGGTTFSYGNNLAFFRSQNDGKTSFNSLLIGPEGLGKFVIVDSLFIPEEETLIETTSDKQFIAVTEISEKEYVERELEGYTGGQIKYEEGMRIRYHYIFDKDTKELLQIDAALFYPDDSMQDLGPIKYSFGVDFLDPLESEENKDYVTAASDPNLSRTVKVTYGPGTEKEQTIEYIIPEEYPFYIFTNDYVSEVYTDSGCTELYEGSDATGADLELFVPLG